MNLPASFGKPLLGRESDTKASRKSRRVGIDVIRSSTQIILSAELQRQENQELLRSLDLSGRQMVAKTQGSAGVGSHGNGAPELSGIVGAHLGPLADEIEARYLELTYGPEIAEIKAIEEVLAEADASDTGRPPESSDEFGDERARF